MRFPLFKFALLSLAVGCNRSVNVPASAPADRQANSESGSQRLAVALLGDDTRVEIAERFGLNKSVKVHGLPKGATASDIASAVTNSDIVLLVTDAAQGPLPAHREHCLILRQLEMASIALLFANTKQLNGFQDARELIELEELEVRELLNAYALPGDTVMCFHETKLPVAYGRQIAAGMPALHDWLRNQRTRARDVPPSTTATRISVEIYVMSEQESTDSKALTTGDSIGVFLGGSTRKAQIQTDSKLSRGLSASAELVFQEAISCTVLNHFIVLADDHAVGAGVVTGIIQ